MAAKEEAMAVEDMEVGLDYWLPCDKLELKTAAPKSCAEIRLSPTYLVLELSCIKPRPQLLISHEGRSRLRFRQDIFKMS